MPSNLVHLSFNKNSSSPGQADAPSWTKKTINYTWHQGATEDTTVTLPTVQCTLNFTIPNNMNPPVLFYYQLTNFYQNHRRYAKSFNNDQLSGKAVSPKDVHGSDCTPLTTETIDGVQKPYYPCGLAPNSLFNDTFSSPVLLNVPGGSSPNRTYQMENNTDISWSSDKELYGQSKYNWSDVIVPPNWQLRYPNGYSDEYFPDLVNDEAFQVWMRLAGLPTFSKLAQRNDKDVMEAGTYTVDINHSTSPSPLPFPCNIISNKKHQTST